MELYAGPCLVNDNQKEIENVWKTAEALRKINIRFKIWGGGTHPSRYVPGIGTKKGAKLLWDMKKDGYKVGTEIRDFNQLKLLNSEFKKLQQIEGIKQKLDFIWIAARSSSNYHLIDNLFNFHQHIIIKRRMDMTIEEIWSIHDMVKHVTRNTGNKVSICDRGIIDFTRSSDSRWSPDFKGMLKTKLERPDINLLFDPAHCVGKAEYIFPMIKAANQIGVDGYMLEVYADKTATQTDQAQALSLDEFNEIYDYLRYGR